MAVTAQTPTSKIRTIVPLHAKPGRRRTNRLFGEHSASGNVSSCAYLRPARTHTLCRQRDLCASAGGLEVQDGGLDLPVVHLGPPQSPSEDLLCAIVRPHGGGSVYCIVRTWERIDAVQGMGRFASSIALAVGLARHTQCTRHSLDIASIYGGSRLWTVIVSI